MKTFEFRLERIADYRRQQSDLAKNQLQVLLGQMQMLDDERSSIEKQRAESRTSIDGQTDLTGGDLNALARYQSFLARRLQQIDQKKMELAVSIEKQRSAAIEAERNVKLLDRLRDRKLQEWQAASNRELENLAADSHMARLASEQNAARAARPRVSATLAESARAAIQAR